MNGRWRPGQGPFRGLSHVSEHSCRAPSTCRDAPLELLAYAFSAGMDAWAPYEQGKEERLCGLLACRATPSQATTAAGEAC